MDLEHLLQVMNIYSMIDRIYLYQVNETTEPTYITDHCRQDDKTFYDIFKEDLHKEVGYSILHPNSKSSVIVDIFLV